MTVNSTENRLVEKMGDKNKLKKKMKYEQHSHTRLSQKSFKRNIELKL